MDKKKLRYTIFYIMTFVMIVIGDQLTKYIVSASMKLGQSEEIIENFFYYTYSHNEGAAWGILSGHIWLFVLISIGAAIMMAYYFKSTKPHEKLTRYGIILTYAGLVGNLIDRVWLGYVRDFIDFVIFGYDFPIFNIADIAVCIGVGLIIIEIIFEEYIHGNNQID